MSNDNFKNNNFINNNNRCGCWCSCNSCLPNPCLCSCIGPPGPAGPQGPTGPQGEPGVSGSSTIIPYSSGHVIELESDDEGNRYGIAIIGFGSGEQIRAPTDPIDFNESISSGIPQYSFSMPSNGTITALTAYFSMKRLDEPRMDNIITAQLYSSPVPDEVFMPVPGVTITLGPIAGDDPYGKIVHGIVTDLAVPVIAQERLLLVIYNSTIQGVHSSIYGTISGGLKLEML